MESQNQDSLQRKRVPNFVTLSLWSFAGALIVSFFFRLLTQSIFEFFTWLNEWIIAFLVWINWINLASLLISPDTILNWTLIADIALVVGFSMLGLLQAAKRYQIIGSRVGGILGGFAGYGVGFWLGPWLGYFIVCLFVASGAALGYLSRRKPTKQYSET